MLETKFYASLSFNANAVSFQVSLFIVHSILLAEPKESAEDNSFQNNSELFSNDLLQQGEQVLNATNKLVCFYILTESFNPEIMEGLCTHINAGFFTIDKETHKLKVSDDQEQILAKLLLLKKKSNDLKVILSVGGAGEMGFSEMVLSHATRKIFIKSCLEFIKKFGIDGIDLDWEWPVAVNGNEKEKIKFVQLLREIQKEFSLHKKKYILSVEVPAAQAVIELGYYVQYIADFVDYVNVMCYDYHYFTKFFPFTGHNAPLYSSHDDFFSKSNVNYSISFWIAMSMPREKIVLGVPTYGHTFKLTFQNHHSLVAPAKGFGLVGKYGFAGYQLICQFLKNKGTTVVYDDISKTPYAYQFPEWISFDNEQSLAIKVAYALEEKLAGVMIFSVNTDDFTGSCKGDNISLPLIKKMIKEEEEEEMVSCPYNLAHLILKSRMPAHLIKCRQQHAVDKFTTCPFNSSHDVPDNELQHHIDHCPDRKNLENFVFIVGEPAPMDVVAELEVPASTENWDEDETPGVSYLDVMDKRLEDKKLFRNPVGLSKRKRKDFYKSEVLKFEKIGEQHQGGMASTSDSASASTSDCAYGGESIDVWKTMQFKKESSIEGEFWSDKTSDDEL